MDGFVQINILLKQQELQKRNMIILEVIQETFF